MTSLPKMGVRTCGSDLSFMMKPQILEAQFWAAKGKKLIMNLAGRKVTEGSLQMDFEREGDGGWYAVIPTWPGPKSALAMVDGADTFLDGLTPAKGPTRIGLHLSLNEQDGAWRKLDYLLPHPFADGAYYVDCTTGAEMWLCGVTEFVFGQMPPYIWFKVQH